MNPIYKMVALILATLSALSYIGWLINENKEKAVTIARQEISIENAKLQKARDKQLYDAKVIEVNLNKETMIRIEREIRNIKTEIKKFKPGTTGGISI